jgi:hypothetical protein
LFLSSRNLRRKVEIFAVTSVCTMELEREVKAPERVGQMRPAARIRQDEVDRLKAEAADLKDTARLEDLHVWEMRRRRPQERHQDLYLLNGILARGR